MAPRMKGITPLLILAPLFFVATLRFPQTSLRSPRTSFVSRIGALLRPTRTPVFTDNRQHIKCNALAKLKVAGKLDDFAYAKDAPKVKIPRMLFDSRLPDWFQLHKKNTGNHTLDAILDAGFQGVASANFPRESNEEGVGDALDELRRQGFKRSDVFIMTRYYPKGLQMMDSTPYDRQAPAPMQVRQSFINSQRNLNTERFDAFIWDATAGVIVRDEDLQAWEEIENLYLEGRTKLIGLGGFPLHQYKEIYEHAEIKPMIIADTVHAHLGWNREVREWCKENGIVYMAKELLHWNDWAMKDDEIYEIAARYGVRPEQVIYRFAMQAGMVPLIQGPQSYKLRLAIGAYDFELDDEEMHYIETMDSRYDYPHDYVGDDDDRVIVEDT